MPRVGALPGGCAGNERRRLACLSGVAPARTFWRRIRARYRTRCKSIPRSRSAGSHIAGTSSLAPQCHPLQGLDNAVRHVHKRTVELPLARTAPKARGLTAKSCPGPSPLRRQALRITKMKADEHRRAGISIGRGVDHARPLTASNPFSSKRGPTPGYLGGLFLASKTGLILESAPVGCSTLCIVALTPPLYEAHVALEHFNFRRPLPQVVGSPHRRVLSANLTSGEPSGRPRFVGSFDLTSSA